MTNSAVDTALRRGERPLVVAQTWSEVHATNEVISSALRSAGGVEGARFRNGELVTVARVEKTGALVVNDERGATKALAPSQRLFVRGYAVTSYAPQGKTVDTVIVADAGNRAATNAQQWYVGISRARMRVVVLTPDKMALRENIQRSGERELALRDDPKRNESKVAKEIHAQITRARINQTVELIRQQEFVRRRMAQYQSRGIRL